MPATAAGQHEQKDAQMTDEHDTSEAADGSVRNVAVLLETLFIVGANEAALFVLAQCPGLIGSRPSVSAACNHAIESEISSLWRGSRSFTGPASHQFMQTLGTHKSRPTDIRYRDSDLKEPDAARATRTLGLAGVGRSWEHETSMFAGSRDRHDDGSSRSLTDLYSTIAPLLRVAGVYIYRCPALVAMLCTLGKQCLQVACEEDRHAALDSWAQVIRSNILPAVALMAPNPNIISLVYALVKEYDQERRFAFYGEWHGVLYRSIPELRVQLIRSEKETKDILRRISKTNAKDFGRLLAKASHTNPCVVLTIALNQIESYDNLVEVVIEASRYFTMLTFDVLSFVLLTLLSADNRPRLKADKTSIAHWLQSLSDFNAKIFKRYSHLDPTPVLTLVAKRLSQRQSVDLSILEDLMREMTGIAITSDLSDEQLAGCTGGPALRAAALSLVHTARSTAGKSAARFFQALERTRLTLPICVLTARQSLAISFVLPDDESHVKLLSNLSDHVSVCRARRSRARHLDGSKLTWERSADRPSCSISTS